jgi:chromosome segregation ATPase
MEVLRKKAIHLKLDLEQALAAKHNHKADFEKYQAHLQTIPLQPLYREIEMLESNARHLETELTQIKERMPALTLEKEDRLKMVEKARIQLAEAKNVWESTQPLLEQANDLDKELISLQENFKKKRNDYLQICNEVNTLQEKSAQLQANLSLLLEQQSHLRIYIQNHAQDACLETEVGLIEQNIQTLYNTSKEIVARRKEAELLLKEQQYFQQELSKAEQEANSAIKSARWKESQLKDIENSIQQLLEKKEPEELEQQLQNLNKQYLHRQNQLMYAKEFVQKYDKLQLLQQEIP